MIFFYYLIKHCFKMGRQMGIVVENKFYPLGISCRPPDCSIPVSSMYFETSRYRDTEGFFDDSEIFKQHRIAIKNIDYLLDNREDFLPDNLNNNSLVTIVHDREYP